MNKQNNIISSERIEQVCKAFNTQDIFSISNTQINRMKESYLANNVIAKFQIIDEINDLFEDIANINETFMSCETCINYVSHSRGITEINKSEQTIYNFSDFLEQLCNYINENIGGIGIFKATNTHIQINRYYFCPSTSNDINNSLYKQVYSTIIEQFVFSPMFQKVLNTYKDNENLQSFANNSIRFDAGISLSVIAVLSNELALAYLTFIRDHLEETYIKQLNEDDAKRKKLDTFIDAGGNGNWAYYKDHNLININTEWIKESQVIYKKYNITDLLSKKVIPFELTFKSIDDCELSVSGHAKVILNGDEPKASVNCDDILDKLKYSNNKNDINNVDVLTYFKYGKKIKSLIVKRLKEYFIQVAKENQ